MINIGELYRTDYKEFFLSSWRKLFFLGMMCTLLPVYMALFGDSNILTAVSISIIGLAGGYDLRLSAKSGAAALFSVTALIPFFAYAARNAAWGLPLNIIAVFFIMIVFSENVSHKCFFGYLMYYIFEFGSNADGTEFLLKVATTTLTAAVVAAIYYFKNRKNGCSVSVFDAFKKLDFKSERAFLAYRMTIGLAVGLFVNSEFGFVKGIWICLTVASVTQLATAETRQRMFHRLCCTLIGAGLFYLFFLRLLPAETLYPVSMLLNFFYQFVFSYPVRIIFITINALNAAQTLFAGGSAAILTRIIFICTGVLIAFALNLLELLRRRFDGALVRETADNAAL